VDLRERDNGEMLIWYRSKIRENLSNMWRRERKGSSVLSN